MARIRGIKPDFFKDEDLATLPFSARLFFAGLLTHVDRAGRIEYRPKRLKVEIMPYDDVNIEEICGLLNNPNITNRPDKRFILIYEEKDQRYIQVLTFLKHQRPHHLEKPSTIPAPNINLLKSCETCQEPSLSGQTPSGTRHEPDEDGINPPVPCSLFLVPCNGKGDLPPNFEPDRITSDTPLPPLLQGEWDRLMAVYPKPQGIIKGRDKAVRLFVKSAERGRILKNAGHYSCSPDAQSGFVMGLDKFVLGGFRDYDEKPLGRAAEETGRDWKKELEQDSREAEADRGKIKTGTVKSE